MEHEWRAAGGKDTQVAGLSRAGQEDIFAMLNKGDPLARREKSHERSANQVSSRNAQQQACPQIGFVDYSSTIQRQMSDGSNVIQLLVPIAGDPQLRLRPAKLLILPLQLDLIHTKFVR